MRSLFSLLAISWLLLLAIGVPPGASAQDIFVTPVANAPFSAVVNVERSRILHDGSIGNFKSIRNIGRDSRGRIHNESRVLVPAAYGKTPPLIRIHLYDPQTRISAMLDPQAQTFWTKTVNHPPSAVPPTIRYASPPGDALPQNEFTKQEDLGIHEMEGLPVHGVRETQTIPAESSTGKEIDITDEYWYSDDLRINLMIKHSDPRTGTVTMTVADITRVEPDPSLFEIPDRYKPARTGQEADR
jgi:hypothetical protein